LSHFWTSKLAGPEVWLRIGIMALLVGKDKKGLPSTGELAINSCHIPAHSKHLSAHS
jgi:hypothetical protein